MRKLSHQRWFEEEMDNQFKAQKVCLKKLNSNLTGQSFLRGHSFSTCSTFPCLCVSGGKKFAYVLNEFSLNNSGFLDPRSEGPMQ